MEKESLQTIGKEWEEGTPEIDMSQICFVKALNDTRGILVEGDGRIVLPTLARTTNGERPRITNHTAINHLVNSNLGGDWSNPLVLVLLPGIDTIQANGLPENLHHCDTFWYGDITLPESAVLIWNGYIPEKFISISHTNLIFTPDTELVMEIHSLEKILQELDGNITNEDELSLFNTAEIQLTDKRKELHTLWQEYTSSILEKLGYTHLPNENGNYSSTPQLDEAVWNLTDRLGIAHSTQHSDTFSRNMEQINMFQAGPISILLELNKKVDTKYTLNDAFNSFDLVIQDFKPTSKGDYDVLRIFLAELIHYLNTYPDNLVTYKDELEKLRDQYNLLIILEDNHT